MVRWGANGSAVAIAPNFILTTAHQGLSSQTVNVGGTTYKFTEDDVHEHPDADLRVVKISTLTGEPANLSTYVGLFNPRTDGSEMGREVAIGGYGKGAGTPLTSTSGAEYGYSWASSGNTTLRWGANRIDNNVASLAFSDMTSDILVNDFDPIGRYGAVQGEAAAAMYDSGGGWFINVNGQWKLAGLNAYVEHSGQSWFQEPGSTRATGDINRAVQVSSYSNFIYSTFAELYLTGDMDGNGTVDNFDILPFELALTSRDDYLAQYPALANYAQRGDINFDGFFNNFDLEPFENLLVPGGFVEELPVELAAVPEPSSLVLLGAGLAALAILARRSRSRASA